MSAPLPDLAVALKAYRERVGLTAKEAAEQHDVPLRTWGEWEQRGSSPRGHLPRALGRIMLELLDR